MKPLEIVFIDYSFCQTGLSPLLVNEHQSYCARYLAKAFPAAQIDVKALPQLAEGADFQLTAYDSRCNSSPVSTEVAAKIVVPHLRWVRESRRLMEQAALFGIEAAGVSQADLAAAVDTVLFQRALKGLKLPNRAASMCTLRAVRRPTVISGPDLPKLLCKIEEHRKKAKREARELPNAFCIA